MSERNTVRPRTSPSHLLGTQGGTGGSAARTCPAVGGEPAHGAGGHRLAAPGAALSLGAQARGHIGSERKRLTPRTPRQGARVRIRLNY